MFLLDVASHGAEEVFPLALLHYVGAGFLELVRVVLQDVAVSLECVKECRVRRTHCAVVLHVIRHSVVRFRQLQI